MLPESSIPRIDSNSPETFRRDFLLQQKPVVIEGGLTHWPAFKLWTDEYLLRYCGDAEVVIKSNSDYVDGKSLRETEEQGIVGLREAIRHKNAKDPAANSYVRESDILEKLPDLRKDVIDLPYIPEGTNPLGPYLWIGPVGTKARMHWDPWNNIFGQVRGQKKFILLPHEQIHLTYPNQFDIAHAEGFPFIQETCPGVVDKMKQAVQALEDRGEEVTGESFQSELPRHLDEEDIACLVMYLHDINNCHVNAEIPDFEKHPKFQEVEPVEFTLEEGDLLFIPYCHLHYVRSLTPSISINWFFDQSPEEISMFNDSARIAVGHLAP